MDGCDLIGFGEWSRFQRLICYWLSLFGDSEGALEDFTVLGVLE